MHPFEAIQQRVEDAFDFGRWQPADALDALTERFTQSQRHHHVGGAVLFEEVENADDGRRVFQLCQRARLLEKTLARPQEITRQFGRARHHRHIAFPEG